MSGLSRADFNEFQIKYVVGKAIPLQDLTYLQTLEQEIEERYPKAFQQFLNIKPAKVVTVVDESLTQELRNKDNEIKVLKDSMETLKGEMIELRREVLYSREVLQREPVSHRSKLSPAEKQLEDEGFVADK